MSAPPRPFCYTCHAPRVACVCAHVEPVTPRHRVVVLRHPSEARRTVNTARLIPLVLRGARLVDGLAFDADDVARLADGRPARLLFPSPDADPPAALAQAEPSTIFVVDGTWSQAKGLLNRSPALRALPAVRIDPSAPSRYRVRKQPRPGYLCTLEAIAELLGAAGDAEAAAALARPFDALVAFQLERIADGSGPRFRARTGGA